MPVVTTAVELCLSENAKTVLERRYLRKSGGKVIETPEEMFWRVARGDGWVREEDSGEVMENLSSRRSK